MNQRKPLLLHEEILLLAIRDEDGLFATGFVEQVVAGAILAELMLDQWIRIQDDKKKHVELLVNKPFGDPIIDQGLQLMRDAEKPAALKTWLERFARIKDLRHQVARQLCNKGILRADEEAVLWVFKRRVYPEINPEPEYEIVERLRLAIFRDDMDVDVRTAVLVSLAKSADILHIPFSRKELKPRRERIKRIAQGEVVAQATQEVITAMQMAVMVAAIMPAMIAATTASH